MAEEADGSVEVEIRAKLETLEQGLRQARQRLDVFAGQTKGAQDALGGLNKSSVDLSSALRMVATQLAIVQGPLGPIAGRVSFLATSFGRLGVVMATGAGAIIAVYLAMRRASQAAQVFADDMLRVRDASLTLGLLPIQFQAIADEGSKFALGEGRIQMALQRFTASMDEMRRGQGELFDLVRRVDPALALQMAQARSTAEAIDFLAQVYAKAGDARARLDRLIGGRGGGTLGLLFEELGRQGGVGRVTEEFRRAGDAIDQHMIEKVARLKAEIDDMTGDAQRNFASIFSVELLEVQYRATELWRDLSRTARSFAISDDLRKFLEGPAQAAAGWVPEWIKNLSAWSHLGGPTQTLAAIRHLLTGGAARMPGGTAATFDERFPTSAPIPLPPSRPSAVVDRSAMELTLNLERERVTTLGAAATAVEKLRLREKELGLALYDNKITQGDYNRALTDARMDAHNLLLGLRIGLLGEDARISDIVAKTQNDVNKAQAQGAKLTEQEIALIKERARLRFEYSRLEGPRGQLQFEREQLFRGDIDATVAARMRGVGLPIDLDSTIAQQLRLNEQLRIGKDLAIDFASGFARDMRNGVKAAEALSNALGRLADRLIDMALNQAISGLFGVLFGGGGGKPFDLFGFMRKNADGNVFSGGNIIPFAQGGVVTRPTLFPMANGTGLMGEAGPEAVMPLKRGPGGRLGVEVNKGNHDTQALAMTVHVVVNDEKFSAYVEDGAGRVVARSTPQIIGAAVAQSSAQAPGSVSRYQHDRGGEYRV